MTQVLSQPNIGISCADIATPSAQAMIRRVSEAGGAALPVDNHAGRKAYDDIENFSGLVIMGNDYDIDPIHYIHRYPDGDPRKSVHPSTRSELESEQARARAKYENAIISIALKKSIPMLCICGGMQRLNVVCGGTLHQHVPDIVGDDRLMQQSQGKDAATPTIPVIIEPATRLSIIARRVQMSFVKTKLPGLPKVVMENSFRHQSIDMVGKGLRVSALSDVIRLPDGTSRYLVEAIESSPEGPYGKQFMIGVQWHPEFCASDIGKELVKTFVKSAALFASDD